MISKYHSLIIKVHNEFKNREALFAASRMVHRIARIAGSFVSTRVVRS